jgi:hypothetical protein
MQVCPLENAPAVCDEAGLATQYEKRTGSALSLKVRKNNSPPELRVSPFAKTQIANVASRPRANAAKTVNQFSPARMQHANAENLETATSPRIVKVTTPKHQLESIALCSAKSSSGSEKHSLGTTQREHKHISPSLQRTRLPTAEKEQSDE